MKKNLYLIFFITFSLLLFQSCEKEEIIILDQQNASLQSKNQILLDTFNKKMLTDLVIDWNSQKTYVKTYEENFEIFNINEVDKHLNSSIGSQTLMHEYEMFNQKNNRDNSFYKLIAIKNSEESLDSYFILKFIPSNNAKTTNNISYLELNNFTGTINRYNAIAQNKRSEYYKNGILIDVITHSKKDRFPQGKSRCLPPPNALKPTITELNGEKVNVYANRCEESDGNNGGNWINVPTTTATDWYWVFTNGSNGEIIGINYSRTTYQTTYEWVYIPNEVNYNGHNYYYENYNEDTNQPLAQEHVEHISENTMLLVAPDTPISNIEDYLKCFDTSKPATLTIYVDQPIANSNKPFTTGEGKAGHSFIGITQGEITRFFGLYPNTNANPANPNDPHIFGNNENSEYDVSITYPISSASLLNIIEDANNYNFNYDLNNNNCTDFVIDAAGLCGIDLPDPQSSWLGGGGSNPGAFGEAIRNMEIPNNATRNNNGGTSNSNSGNCN